MKENLLDDNFLLLIEKIKEARNPEEIFGSLEGAPDKLQAGRSIYRQLSKIAHPDLYTDPEAKIRAQTVFVKLSGLWQHAQAKLKDGTYGDINFHEAKDPEIIIVKHNKKQYQVFSQATEGEVSNHYPCIYSEASGEVQGEFKVVRDPADNDLLENEARILRLFSDDTEYEKLHVYVPTLIDSFKYVDSEDPTPRQVNILSLNNQFYSLKEVKDYYSGGMDPKDMAWIFRRLLVGLGFAHNKDIIHGSILPPNIFILPQKHGLVISEWSFAVSDPKSTGERISAVSNRYEDWYPTEVTRKDIPIPSLDIFMGARCMVDLLGGDPTSGILPDSIDRRLRFFFKGCLMPNPAQRPKDAWDLLQEFNELIEDLWGPRRFHPFSMPKRDENSPFR